MAFSISSRGFSDHFSKQIAVSTNDPDHPVVTLKCTAKILMPLRVSPERIKFGTVMRDGPNLTRKVIIEKGDGGPIAPMVHPPKQPNLEAKLCEIEASERYELEVTLARPCDAGPFNDVLTVETGLDQVPELYVVVTGEAAPRVAVSPNRLVFPKKPARPMEQTLYLQWDDGQPAAIRSTETTLPDAKVAVSERRGRQIIVVSLPKDYDPPPGQHSVTFTTDDPVVPSYTVPIQFTGSAATRRAARGHEPAGPRTTPRKTGRKSVDRGSSP